MKTSLWLCGILVASCLQAGASDTAIDLPARYPTTLTSGDMTKARPWDFQPGDIYHIQSFKFSLEKAGLSVDIGEADAGIGHCADGAIWALILPRAQGTLSSKESPEPEKLKNLWVQFHPSKLSSLFPAATVLGPGKSDLYVKMFRLGLKQMDMRSDLEGNLFIPEPSEMTIAAQTDTNALRYFPINLKAQTAGYQPELPPGPHPKVLSVAPADGATGVESETDVVVTFDQPMDPLGAKIEWQPSQSKIITPLHYIPDKNEFVMRARFASGEIAFRINDKLETSREGFCTPDGAYALPYAWHFAAQSDAEPAPAVVSISPAQGTPANLLTFVEITFDQPMLDIDEAKPRTEVKDDRMNRKPEPVYLLNPLARADNTATFTLPILFPPKWDKEITLKGFKNVKGIEAPPITLQYAVGDERFSDAFRARLHEAAKNPALIELLVKMKDARAKIHSLNETIQQTYSHVFPPPSGESYTSAGLSLKWREPMYFAMDVSRAMQCLFRMGNDGTTAWFAIQGDRFPDSRVETCPVAEIQDTAFAACDPFHLMTADPAASIRDLELEYLGLAEVNGRQCHRVQRWHIDVHEFGKEKQVYGLRYLWFIDAETFLPVQLVTDSGGGSRYTLTFAYDHVNEEFPVETFAPPTLPGLPTSPAPPLDKDYVKRFFHVNDGADGNVSCRWGKKGPKGTYSSGMS